MPVRYPDMDTADYTSIIDERAFTRLVSALNNVRERGAVLIPLLPGLAWDARTRKINPHLVINAPQDTDLLQQEIFGPILPIGSYRRLEEVVATVNAGPRPLAMYPFSNDARTVRMLLLRKASGHAGALEPQNTAGR